jgi:hypothetical protein
MAIGIIVSYPEVDTLISWHFLSGSEGGNNAATEGGCKRNCVNGFVPRRKRDWEEPMEIDKEVLDKLLKGV